MMVQDFWRTRERAHSKKMSNYLRYIFNDHFILFLFIFFGGLAYLYSEFIKQLDTSQLALAYIVASVLALLPLFGKLSTLLKPADKLYFIPMEEEFNQLMSRIRLRSLLLPGLLLAFAVAAAMPLFLSYQVLDYSNAWQLWLLLFLLKLSDIYVQQIEFKSWRHDWLKVYYLVSGGSNIILVLAFLFLSRGWALFLASLIFLLVFIAYRRFFKPVSWNWEYMINKEQKRINRQLKLINVFTDVPEIKSQAKRHRMFDFLIAFFQKEQGSAEMYLISRSFFRQSDYIYLYLRLILMAALVLVFVPYPWMRLLSGLLFLFMIGFQIIPLAYVHDNHRAQAVFPLAEDLIQRSVKQLNQVLLLFASIFIGVVGLFNTTEKLYNLANILVFLMFSILFSQVYLPMRLKTRKR